MMPDSVAQTAKLGRRMGPCGGCLAGVSPTTTTVQISSLDPSALSDGDAAALAAVSNAVDAADAPHLDPVDAAYVQGNLAYGHDMHPVSALLVARDDAALVGYAELHVSRWDNPAHLYIELQVHPEHRDRGVDDALLARVVTWARAAGRSQLMGDAWVDSPAASFWERQGFTVGSRSAHRRLVLGDLDQPRLAELLAGAEAASDDYELVALPNTAPEAMVPGLLGLHSAMNDAPLDDLVLDDDEWPVARLRAYEQAMTARRFRLHRLVARRRSDGELGGHTVVVVEDDRPLIAAQEDTAVVAGHRGHKLGLRLKIAMLHQLAEQEPQVQHVDTWNAESNRHMLAVNDAIGCVVVGRAVELQRTLP